MNGSPCEHANRAFSGLSARNPPPWWPPLLCCLLLLPSPRSQGQDREPLQHPVRGRVGERPCRAAPRRAGAPAPPGAAAGVQRGARQPAAHGRSRPHGRSRGGHRAAPGPGLLGAAGRGGRGRSWAALGCGRGPQRGGGAGGCRGCRGGGEQQWDERCGGQPGRRGGRGHGRRGRWRWRWRGGAEALAARGAQARVAGAAAGRAAAAAAAAAAGLALGAARVAAQHGGGARVAHPRPPERRLQRVRLGAAFRSACALPTSTHTVLHRSCIVAGRQQATRSDRRAALPSFTPSSRACAGAQPARVPRDVLAHVRQRQHARRHRGPSHGPAPHRQHRRGRRRAGGAAGRRGRPRRWRGSAVFQEVACVQVLAGGPACQAPLP